MRILSNIYVFLGGLVAITVAITAFLLTVFTAGKNQEKLKNAEQQIQDEQAIDQRVTKGLAGDQSVRTDIANGGVRTDDGHKRVR